MKNLFFCTLLSIVSSTAVANNANSGVGINLTGINYWSSQWTTIDVMKHASNGSGELWATSNAITYEYNTGDQSLLDLDEQGWPRSLPSLTSESPFHYVTTIIFHDNLHYARGDYVILYEGEGELYYSGPELISTAPGRDVVRMGDNSYFHLQIHSTDPNNTGNYIRNVRIIAPGGSCSPVATDFVQSASDCNDPATFMPFEQSYAQRVFHPLFLKDMSQFRTLRFMQLLNTIDNPVENWHDRPKYNYASWALNGGSPFEVAITMANMLHAEGWYNLPVRVNDEYVRQFARLLKNTADEQSDIFIEFGNELWNNAWPYINDAIYMEEQGKALWPNTNYHDIEYRMNYYGMRSSQVCNIVKTEFADQAARIKCVMGGQTGVPWISEQALNCPIYASGVNAKCAENMDVLAVGSYFGGYFADQKYLDILNNWAKTPSTGLDNLFTEMHSGLLRSLTFNPDEPIWWQAPEHGALAQAKENISGNLALAQQNGLMLAAYEGGQHLTYAGDRREGRDKISDTLFLTANRDPRMANAFTEHLEDWRDSGAGLYIVFESIGRWDTWGAFPLKEYQTQPRQSAVKFDAVLKFIEHNTCWWQLCERNLTHNDDPIGIPTDVIYPPPVIEPDPTPALTLAAEPIFETNGVRLSWQLSNVDQPIVYKISRVPTLLTHSYDNVFENHWLPLDRQITYQIEAVVENTGVLIASKQIVTKAGDSELPSVPRALTVQSDGAYGAQLTWQASSDNYGVKLYKIVRNGQMYTHTSDTQFNDPWPPQGIVTYAVYAQDLAGNLSPISQTVELEITHN